MYTASYFWCLLRFVNYQYCHIRHLCKAQFCSDIVNYQSYLQQMFGHRTLIPIYHHCKETFTMIEQLTLHI